MADRKISGLPIADGDIASNDLVPFVDVSDDRTERVTIKTLHENSGRLLDTLAGSNVVVGEDHFLIVDDSAGDGGKTRQVPVGGLGGIYELSRDKIRFAANNIVLDTDAFSAPFEGFNGTGFSAATPSSTGEGIAIDGDGFITVQRESGTGDGEYCMSVFRGTDRRFTVLANGDVVNTGGNYGTISDERLKENISPASSQYDDVVSLGQKVVNYNLIGDDLRQIGLIAQEVEQISPGLVSEGLDGFKSVKTSVAYMKMLKAFSEMAEKVEALEARIAELESA